MWVKICSVSPRWAIGIQSHANHIWNIMTWYNEPAISGIYWHDTMNQPYLEYTDMVHWVSHIWNILTWYNEPAISGIYWHGTISQPYLEYTDMVQWASHIWNILTWYNEPAISGIYWHGTLSQIYLEYTDMVHWANHMWRFEGACHFSRPVAWRQLSSITGLGYRCCASNHLVNCIANGGPQGSNLNPPSNGGQHLRGHRTCAPHLNFL